MKTRRNILKLMGAFPFVGAASSAETERPSTTPEEGDIEALPTFEGLSFKVREIHPWEMAYPCEDETPEEFSKRRESLIGKVQFLVRMTQEEDAHLVCMSVMSPYGEKSQRRELLVKAFESAAHGVYNEMVRKHRHKDGGVKPDPVVFPKGITRIPYQP